MKLLKKKKNRNYATSFFYFIYFLTSDVNFTGATFVLLYTVQTGNEN